MDKALLVGGSSLNVDDIEGLIQDRLVVAVDGGYDSIIEYTIPDYLVGDQDSVVSKIDSKVKQILNPELDDLYTDMEVGLRYLVKLGIKDILIVAALGGRIDHELANIQLLKAYSNLDITILDKYNRIKLGKGTTTIYKDSYKYLSILPLYDRTTISIEGVKYPLDRHTINIGDSLTISNEIKKNKGVVTTDKQVIIIQSK